MTDGDASRSLPTPTTRLPPRAGEVQVWRAPLNQSPSGLASINQLLSADEQERAGRFLEPAARDRFVARRGWLRWLLAGYLEVRPGELEFAVAPGGKPALTPVQASWLRFSSSHSADLVVIAVANGVEVGVDVEGVDRRFPTDKVAKRFFSAAELADLRALSDQERVATFFAIWTRKEAYLKGLGIGIDDRSLQMARVTGGFQGDGAGVAAIGGPDLPSWSVGSLDVGPGYAAAVAVPAAQIEVPTVAQPVWSSAP